MDLKNIIYLVLIIIISIICTYLLFYYKKINIFYFKIREKNKEEIIYEEIHCGNVSAFFDNKLNVYIISYVKDLEGIGRATNNIQFLMSPYKEEKLGEIIRTSMNNCKSSFPCNNKEIMHKLGFENWEDFSKGKKNISIHYLSGIGIVLNSTIRNEGGEYIFKHIKAQEKIVSKNISNKELGEIILEIL